MRYVRSELPRSQIYLECLPLFARGLVALPDHKRLLRELRLLERHTHRSGRDTVDHGKNGSDDYSNAVCGVLRDLSTHLSYLERSPAHSPTRWKSPTARPPERRAIGLIATSLPRAFCARRWTMLAEVTPMNFAEANRILRLSDSQLAIVRQAAVPLSPSAAIATSKPSRPSWRRPSASMMRPSKPWSRPCSPRSTTDETGGRHGTQIRRRF